jgi:hypothetical protein
MIPAPSSDQRDHDAELRLERILGLIDDLDRLKGGDPKARQLAIDCMRQELAAAKKPSPPDTTH